MGYQYLTLAHILLLVYDPGIPRIGLAHRAAIAKVEVCSPILLNSPRLTSASSPKLKEMFGHSVA